jgi:hypothetical protein
VGGGKWGGLYFFGLVLALRPKIPKHIRGGWSHYTVISEPVDGNGAQNMVTVQSVFKPAAFREKNLFGEVGGGRGAGGRREVEKAVFLRKSKRKQKTKKT